MTNPKIPDYDPHRSVVGRTIATLKKALDGIISLAGGVAEVATLVAKARAVLR